MKWLAVASVLIALVLCLAPACDSSEEDVTKSPTPVGKLSADVAKTILYDYLASQIRTVTDNLERLSLSSYLFQFKKHWEVHDRDLGQTYLEVTGMGYDGIQLNHGGLWRVHDETGAVEPQNNDAQKLLSYIRLH